MLWYGMVLTLLQRVIEIFQKLLHHVANLRRLSKLVIERDSSCTMGANISSPDSESSELVFEGGNGDLIGKLAIRVLQTVDEPSEGFTADEEKGNDGWSSSYGFSSC